MTTYSKVLAAVAAAVVGGSVHFVASFFSWMIRDAREPSATAIWFWNVLSFPMLTMLGGYTATIWFYQSLLANSIVWGGACGILVLSILRVKGRTNGGS